MTKKIMMVDDSASTIELVKTYIEDYELTGAGSGREMWEALEKSRPELILLDIIMPGETGFQLAEMLSRDDRYSDIPIIFVSAKSTGRDVMEGLKSDVYDYIKKPFDKFELLARINTTLRRKELENRLKEQSIKDYLTDCFNRKYFYDQINQYINYFQRTGTAFSVALLDIDNFKNINDTYGHLAGDNIIARFGSVIRENIRLYDIPVRFGGEEFAIIYLNCMKNEAAKAVQNIQKILRASPMFYEDKKISITFTCGIAEVTETDPEKKIDFESLIKIADEKLYRGKNAGKDIIIAD